jgi:hypothetical protein
MLGLLLALAGIAILLIGLRGRLVDDHPLCSRCGFDLFGLTDSMHCPECGVTLDHPQAKRIGHRRRLPWFIAIGGAATGLIAALLALSIWAALCGTNVDAYKPAAMLKMQVKHGIFGSRESAVLEIVNRVNAKTLPISTIEWLLRDGLGMRVDARAQIRSGDPWPYSIDFNVKNINGMSLFFFTDQIDIGPWGKPAETGYYGSGVGGRHSSTIHVGPIPPGTYDATLRFWFALAPGPTTIAPPPLGRVTLAFPKKLEVVAHDSAKGIRDEWIRAAMLESIRISPTYANQFDGRMLNFAIEAARPPKNVAFDVFVRQGDSEWRVGSFAVRRGEQTNHAIMHEMPDDYAIGQVQTIEIVLRSSVQVAKQQVDITEFWDGEIVLPVKDVKPNLPR